VKLLILGGDGMLGHRLLTDLQDRYEVLATVRQPLALYHQWPQFTSRNTVGSVDARDWPGLVEVIRAAKPQAVINGIGIIKHRKEAVSQTALTVEINALLPHRLRDLCAELGARLIHFSTDCVFSGRAGGYRESDEPDALDLYGRSKLLGEVHDAPGLTIRSSIIGLELARHTGLIEWFLAQRGTIRGFRRAIYTGVTTAEMARFVDRVLTQHPDLHGVWQLASAPISKYDLLIALSRQLGRTDVEIVPDDDFTCDRSLDGTRLREATGYQPPSWDVMLAELARDVARR
jgi:dTDP-4-dehydrorhamnose reductase